MAMQQMLLAGSGELIAIVSATTTNLNASTLFGANYGAGVAKRLIINPGVTVGGTSAGTPALTIPSGLTGSLIIDNYGSIQGAGGVAGTAGVGGVGGDAILAQSACRIINNTGATIYSGGGGGGRGGTGGTGGGGSYGGLGSYQYLGESGWYYGIGSNYAARCAAVCGYTFGGSYANVYASISRYTNPASGCGGCDCCNDDNAQSANAFCCYGQPYITIFTAGGAGGGGGNGGRGRGYNQALATGSAGVVGAAGGANAGAGGTGGSGGTGGDWGATGVNGSTGGTGANGNNGAGSAGATGSAGGLAGFYINGLSTFVTLTNSGTVAGRSN